MERPRRNSEPRLRSAHKLIAHYACSPESPNRDTASFMVDIVMFASAVRALPLAFESGVTMHEYFESLRDGTIFGAALSVLKLRSA